MSNDERGSDSDSDSEWYEELINAVRKKEGRSEVITEETRISRVQECLNEGADVDAVDKNKNTALHFAVKKGYAKLVQFLVEQGAKTDLPNKTDVRSGSYGKRCRARLEKNFKTCEEDQLHSKTELPANDVKSEDIADFFDKLIFAVNQPNEIQLGNVISGEIAAESQFNLLNADLVGASFQTEMLDWFKEKGKEKGKEGRFFSAEDGRAFFDAAERKVNTLVSSGLSLAYPEELRGFGIEFENENQELKDFLIATEPALNVIATEETLPTAIRVDRAIGRSGRFAENDSLIFLHLRTLMLPEIRKRVIRAFESPHSHRLIVIHCETAVKKSLQKLYNRLYESTRRHVGKKIILISRTNSGESKVRLKNCHEIYDHVRFGDLTIESRYKLLGKSVINFQGRRGSTSIGRLLGICSCGELAARQELTNFAATLDTGTLMKLIRGEEIKVGSDPKGLGEIEDYYINRRIDRRVVIKIDILKSPSTFDLFAISGADAEVITGLVEDEENVQRFDEIDQEKQHLVKFIILDTEQDTEQFESLCRESFRNVHWLKWEWGKLIWIKSQGNIGTLIAHRDVGEIRGLGDLRVDKTERYWLDDELVDHVEGREDLVVISDAAGMGKTTLFTYLGKMLKRKTPESWVIVINLNDFTDVLQKELKSQSFNGSDVNGAIEFFVEYLSNLENDLEKTVLTMRMIMKNRNGAGVALIFDGFDEISPEYEKTVINVLLTFQKVGVAKLLVATRPHMRGALEEKLGIFSYAIEPFSEENQFEFLVRFWKRGLGWKDIDERIGERLRTYARSVIKTVVRSIDDWVKEFAGIPLQTRMIAEVFQDDRERKVDFETCEEFLRSTNDEPRLPGKMEIVDMYGRFVDKKYYIYRTEKKKDDATNLGVEEDSQDLREIFLKRHEKLALHTLFSAKGFPNILGPPVLPLLLAHQEIEGTNAYLGKIVQGRERTGIITRVVNGKAEFIHRTFAEYFAAIFLLNTLIAKQTDHDPNVREFIVKVILSEHTYKIIRSFFNGLIKERHLLSDTRYAVNSATIDAWKSVLQGCHDLFGQTIFHRAAAEQNYDTVKFILNRFNGHDQARRDLINIKDHFGSTVLHLVVSQDPPEQLASLEGQDVATESNSLVDSYNNLPMVEWLVENGALVDVLTNDARTPLSMAAGSGKLDVLKWLIENQRVGIDSRNKYGKTILHHAASAGQLGVVKWLVNVKEADVSARVNDGKTVLHEAAANGQWEVVKWLILGRKIDVDSKGNNNWTVLRVAATSGNFEMVKWLVERGADVNAKSTDGNTVLRVAASERRWAVLKLLVEKGADVNAKSWAGNTVLHQAASRQKWDLVKWLVEEKGSDFNAKGTDNVTVLHQAARGNRWDLVKWLLEEKGVDVDTFSPHEGTVLHLAASRNKWDTVRWLVEEKGADVNVRPSNGMTLLHLAAKIQKWDLVRWLVLDRGAEVDTRASDGLKLLHRAASFGQIELVKSLVEDKGTDIAAGSNDGRTVLHFAAASGEMPLVKWLVEERGVDVGARSHRGETALHQAALGRQWRVVRYLANLKDVDVGAETSNGQTVLLIAIELGNCETIKWLVEEKGLEVNAKFSDGKTIVNHAVASGQFNIVQWLVTDMGADVKTKDSNGETILNEAITAGRCEIFKWLVEVGGADIGTRDNRGGTLLHAAAAAVNTDVIRLLVTSYHVDVSLTNDNDETALELYCNNHQRRYEADQAVLHLLQHGTGTAESTLRHQTSRRPSWRLRALSSHRRTRHVEQRKMRRSMRRFDI